jgi:signal transduction histidine kinase
LGLHIAKQVADRHGAQNHAQPRPGGGSIFGVELRGTV